MFSIYIPLPIHTNHVFKMRNLFTPILIFFLLSISCHFSVALDGMTLVWKPIDNVNDSKVVEIGKFAVVEYNKRSKSSLTFKSVVSGRISDLGADGTDYNLRIAAVNGVIESKYDAVVFDMPLPQGRQLKGFTGPL
ncbi:hypothetical protein L1887_17526 [Cichorium endivia]|nr:hypothetical protein L1887_17526 [Cichorium endivia]